MTDLPRPVKPRGKPLNLTVTEQTQTEYREWGLNNKEYDHCECGERQKHATHPYREFNIVYIKHANENVIRVGYNILESRPRYRS